MFRELRKKKERLTKSKFLHEVFSSLIEVSGTYTVDLAIV